MHTNFAFARRLKWATGWMAVFAFTAACGSAAKTDHGDDDTAGVTTDAPLDGVAGDETLPTDGAAQNDTQSGPQLVIDNPKANATLGGAGAFALRAHVQNPPKSGGPFAVKVADAVSAYVVATGTVDDLGKPFEVAVNLASLLGGSYALRVSVLDAQRRRDG